MPRLPLLLLPPPLPLQLLLPLKQHVTRLYYLVVLHYLPQSSSSSLDRAHLLKTTRQQRAGHRLLLGTMSAAGAALRPSPPPLVRGRTP